jgi:hypothetical protein
MAAVGFGEREAEALPMPRETMKSAAYPAARRLLAAYAVRGLASFSPFVRAQKASPLLLRAMETVVGLGL